MLHSKVAFNKVKCRPTCSATCEVDMPRENKWKHVIRAYAFVLFYSLNDSLPKKNLYWHNGACSTVPRVL